MGTGRSGFTAFLFAQTRLAAFQHSGLSNSARLLKATPDKRAGCLLQPLPFIWGNAGVQGRGHGEKLSKPPYTVLTYARRRLLHSKPHYCLALRLAPAHRP